MMFEHDDWKDFLSLATLCRKAGVPQDRLAMVVAKELADNALDVAGDCEVGLLDEDGFFVADCGEGIKGNDRAIASMFSTIRPLRSSKRLRRPTRGALGNGLRVVAGAVYSTGGSLVVSTRGRTLRLVPLETGETMFEVVGPFDGEGTRVEVRFGPSLDVDETSLAWAEEAIRLAGDGGRYEGKSSAHWFESDAFHRLLQDAGDATVRQVVAEFEGCSEPKAGRIAGPFGKGRLARELDRDDADRLLRSTRERKGKKLATIGDYVTDSKWRAWLQGNRVELNAMSTPQFLGWLEDKFAPYAGKVVPPTEVIHDRLAKRFVIGFDLRSWIGC